MDTLFDALWSEFLPTIWLAAVFPFSFAAFYHYGWGRSTPSESQQRKPRALEESFHVFTILYALSLLGMVTGQITSQSREPAVAAVMPAVLSLVGAVAIYTMTAKNRQQQLLSALLVTLFTLHLLGGIYFGRELRKVGTNVNAQYRTLMETELAKNKVAMDLLPLEQLLRTARENMGLPPLEFPTSPEEK